MKRFHLFLAPLLVVLAPLLSEAANGRLKNFRELPGSLEAVTGFRSRSAEAKSFFQIQSSRLPQTGALTEFTPSTAITLMGYSSFFCEGMIQRDLSLPASSRWAHQQIRSDLGPDLWSPEVRRFTIEEYAALFWQRSLTSDELSTLASGWNDLIAAQSGSPIAGVNALIGLCVTMLSSPEFLLFVP